MAEAEEVVTDVARHATVFARDLWRRHRGGRAARTYTLVDFASRIDLFLTSVFGASLPIRTAQPPAPPTLLDSLFGRGTMPRFGQALPATDGEVIWLPAELGIDGREAALRRYRTMALQQAMRAKRGSARPVPSTDPLVRDVYLLLEALAADAALQSALPGLARDLDAARREALMRRPALARFPSHARSLESLLRRLLHGEREAFIGIDTTSPEASLASAVAMAGRLNRERGRHAGRSGLMKDWWTGELRRPAPPRERVPGAPDEGPPGEDHEAARSARLSRRPNVREELEGEDDRSGDGEGTWMVQADEPHRKAEDPMGLRRPTDRGDESADTLGDMLTELPEVRMVRTPGRPKEFLLSDDPPDSRVELGDLGLARGESGLEYPEWDYRASAYRRPGVTVRVVAPPAGPQAWVDRTLDEHRAMLTQIRRRFEMLQARRVTLRKRTDGEEIDLEACIEALADLRAGSHMDEGLYRTCRPIERNMAIMLLIDVSGSTDGWVSASRRIIDVEREALLLVAIALRQLGEPCAIRAFSGESRSNVTVRPVKSFEEAFDNEVALRIAALEPERYTRAGGAIRHATAELMRQPADHRLLLLMSDGKPNDVDEYEGRYGVEDMHRAVTEARLQGIFPFCLTIDRQAASYLPRIFGANQYALLPRPQLLPTVLLDWMRRLVSARYG